MLFKMVGNRDDAEELAQEAFLRVYRAKESYIPALHGASFSTWFHRIVTNLAINHRRRKRPEPLPDYEQKSTAASAADDAANAESESRIWAALHELPPRQRAALVLTRIEGYSYRDAARIMDVSIEAVRSLIARARGALRVELQPILSTNVPKE
jgi:RNA polymerase sigma-70 factor (ECF subfamily)